MVMEKIMRQSDDLWRRWWAIDPVVDGDTVDGDMHTFPLACG
jgi:hypothetical protein